VTSQAISHDFFDSKIQFEHQTLVILGVVLIMDVAD